MAIAEIIMPKAKAQYFIQQRGESKPVAKKEFFRLRDEEVKNNYVSMDVVFIFPFLKNPEAESK